MLTRDQISVIREAIRDGGTRYLPDICNQAAHAIDLEAEVDRLKQTITSLTGAFDEANATAQYHEKEAERLRAELTALRQMKGE